jgi:hypothetical protein
MSLNLRALTIQTLAKLFCLSIKARNRLTTCKKLLKQKIEKIKCNFGSDFTKI